MRRGSVGHYLRYLETTVVGFHGTAIDSRNHILRTGKFIESRNPDDWLGDGIYFFEGAARASQWANERFGDRGTVIKATIRLGECLDLVDYNEDAWKTLQEAHK